MTISDRLTTAITAILAGATLPGTPTVVAGIETDVNTEESVRVIVSSTSCQLRSQLLPGIYDLSGEVTIFQTIDTQADAAADLKDEFRDLCVAVENVVGEKYLMLQSLASEDSALVAYSWNLSGQDSFMQSRAMGARYSWTCIARQHSHNPT